jgi:hypothetical protein
MNNLELTLISLITLFGTFLIGYYIGRFKEYEYLESQQGAKQ